MRRLICALAASLMLLAAPLAATAQALFPNEGVVGIVPPAGMVEIPGVAGFEDRDAKAAILILEMPSAAYADIMRTFEPEALQSKGVTIEQRRDLELAGGEKAVLLTGYQSVGPVALKKWILLVGGKDVTAMVTVQFPEAASARYSDEAVETALRSIVFRAPPTQDELLARLPFTIGDLEGYRVLKVLGGSAVLLTKGDAKGPDVAGQPYFIISAARGEIREDDRESLAKRAIASVPGVKELRVERGGPLRIGGQPGFELMGKAQDQQSGKPVKVAQWLRFGRTGYLRMVGVAPEETFGAEFDGMRALRDGIDLR
ncbi:hypothetical protein [Ancylobacter radicis]|uniref:Uncharacterized protein n=1 Tax=Ancylobacter radicis TaxID=2836179 RepID=A0ABS5R723_9HYPH|nr:hypothetical protein [Ancylobacter radicis]MBS9477459.1 hypothetical protein [Ancylobacter radicis]